MDYVESTRVVEKFSDGECGIGELTEENLDLQMDANIQMELIRGRNLLQKIQQEQAAVDASIIACRQQIIELSEPDTVATKENAAPPNKMISAKAIENNAKIQSIQRSTKTSDELCAGLRTLTGVKTIEVTGSGDESGVRLLLTIGECSFAMTLDAEKRISDIIVISGKFSLDVDKLLQDCRILPSPQDLRYAVFAAGASQHSVESLKKDLPVLRKSCIVRVLGPLRFEMGLPNSITAVISVHECYPEVPVGVHVESLFGIDDCPEESHFLNGLKSECNVSCFRTINAMFLFLTGPKGLGSRR